MCVSVFAAFWMVWGLCMHDFGPFLGTLAFLAVWCGLVPGFMNDAAKERARMLQVAKDLESAGHTSYAEQIRKGSKA